MELIELVEPIPQPFDFVASIQAHGWVALPPFVWDEPTAVLYRVQQLAHGRVVRLGIQAGQPNGHGPVALISVESASPLIPPEEAEIRQAVRRMLRLDEDLSEFYSLCQQMSGWQLRVQPGGGRLLRCPTLFEDLIYTLCTTNITWTGTKRLVTRLTTTLGAAFPGQANWRAFPSPAAIATAGPTFLKEEIRLGYRSQYVWELAQTIAEGRLTLSAFEDTTQPTTELLKELRRIKGVGPYAAATLLMLLGRYEYLAIDSELHAFVAQKYFRGQPASEAQIKALYAPWGRWQYLAYWFDTPV